MPCFCKNYTEPHHKLDFRRGVWYNKVPMKEVTTKYKMFRLRMRCKPPNACGMLRENTAVCTLCFLVLSASEQMNKQSRLWISKPLHRSSFWSERKTPADFWCFCVSAFCFADWKLNDRLNGIRFCDDFFFGEWARQRRWKSRGRNNIQVKRQRENGCPQL